jgi:hypothetical protein
MSVVLVLFISRLVFLKVKVVADEVIFEYGTLVPELKDLKTWYCEGNGRLYDTQVQRVFGD